MKDPLMTRILDYMKIKNIGKTISIACDIPIRIRLTQYDIVTDNLNCLNKDKQYCDIEEPLYKAIELGEMLKCLELYGSCKYAKDCWVTRRGWCQQRKDKEDEKTNRKRTKKPKSSKRKKA